MELEEKIEKRGLKAENVFVASLLAGLNEFGVLNQGIINLTGMRIGEFLFHFAKVKGFSTSPLLPFETQELGIDDIDIVSCFLRLLFFRLRRR
ncbi:hypothetical protein [Desulfurobacterium sp.]